MVLQMQYRIGIHQFHLVFRITVTDTRDDKRTVQQRFYLLYRLAVHRLVSYLHGNGAYGQLLQMSQPLFGFRLFFPGIDMEQIFQRQQSQNTSDNTQRIRHRIAQCYLRRVNPVQIAVGLLRSAQSRSVGHRSRQDADHCSNRYSRYEMKRHRNQDTDKHNQYRQHVQRKSPFLKGGEKAGPHLQTDRINKQNQSELFQEVE